MNAYLSAYFEALARLFPAEKKAVERIGRDAEVEVGHSERIRAPVVVNAGDMRRLNLRLLPPEYSDPKRRAELQAARTVESVFSVFAAVEAPFEDVCPGGLSPILYAPDRRGVAHSEMRTTAEYFSRANIEISVPCARDPSLAPPGKTGLCLSVAASPEFADGWHEEDPARYESLKKSTADRILKAVSKIIPAARDKLLFTRAATPRTNERHTLNSGGAITGWLQIRDKPVVPQSYIRIPRAIRGSIPGLYQVGHWCISPGGAPVCLMSARLAAIRIARGR